MTRTPVGRMGWALGLTMWALVAGILLEDVSMARAQDSAADSTATGPVNPFGDVADSTATHPGPGQAPAGVPAASDSAMIAALAERLDEPSGFLWLNWLGSQDSQRPSIRGGVDSDRSRFGLSLDLDLPLSILGGFTSKTSYHRDRFREPTLRQEKFNRAFTTQLQRPMSSWGRFDIDFSHRENGNESERAAPSKSIDSALSSTLSGRGVLGQSRVDGKWAIKGSITDRKTKSGLLAGSTAQQLSKGGLSGALGRELGGWGVSVNAGLDLWAGPQALSAAADGSDAREETKTTRGDTLGVNLRWHGGEMRRFTVKLTRQALSEERLDYLKDARGVTLVDPETRLKIVGREHEVRNVVRADLTAEDRLIRNVRYSLRYGIERRETQYELNQQNFVPEESQTLGGDLWYRYAAAGSLKVSMSFIERGDDRQLQGTTNFRGKHFNNTGSVSITLDQRIFSTSNFRLAYSEDISRQIYEYKLDTGTQDIDVLNQRVETKLTAKPFDALNFTALGSYRSTQNINLDPRQVARNNRIQDNWKVTMDYKLNLTPTVSFGQGYQLSIDYTDYVYSFLPEGSQSDRFYKRTQLKTELLFSFRGGTQFTLNHTIDRTRGGTESVSAAGEQTTYFDDPTRRQDENRLYGGMRVPLWRYVLEVGTNRNVRLLRGSTEEFFGDLRISLRGESRFLGDHLVLGLNVGHVWAYGPPRLVRNERDKRYFTSSTHLTWIF